MAKKHNLALQENFLAAVRPPTHWQKSHKNTSAVIEQSIPVHAVLNSKRDPAHCLLLSLHFRKAAYSSITVVKSAVGADGLSFFSSIFCQSHDLESAHREWISFKKTKSPQKATHVIEEAAISLPFNQSQKRCCMLYKIF